MNELISVIIPSYNAGATLATCLEAALASEDEDLIQQVPCRLVALSHHVGASGARNIGARESRGSILFFTDADCLLQANTLAEVRKSLTGTDGGTIVGGTYTARSQDRGFFSDFQSTLIYYAETKQAAHPDYVATHAMAVEAETFRNSGGFTEDFLPILEDVEYSHRMRRAGTRLVMNPNILVRHIFNFSLLSSVRNAIRKSTYWTLYSLRNGDLLADSGTASIELKVNMLSGLSLAGLFAACLMSGEAVYFYLGAAPLFVNFFVNRNLLGAFYLKHGLSFMLRAALYYMTLYVAAVGIGAVAGVAKLFRQRGTQPVWTRRPRGAGALARIWTGLALKALLAKLEK
jgi:GT2 family glycosyltransferase